MGRLEQYDIAVLLDRSGSMSTRDCPHQKSRWEYARESVEAVVARAAQIDQDGIELVVFGSRVKTYSRVTPAKIDQIYAEVEPMGSTATDEALKAVLPATWFADRQAGRNKPKIVLVFTDGEPNDRAAVAKVLVEASNAIRQDADLAVSFVQVGYDDGARRFLTTLDDSLQGLGAKFDIVDTRSMDDLEELGVLGLLEAALDD